jgi:hypothetical protein
VIKPAGFVIHHGYTWHMLGPRNFSLDMHEYMVSRIYRLTGEYPYPTGRRGVPTGQYYVEAVSARVQRLRTGFERRASNDTLRPHDRVLMEKIVFLQSGDVGSSRLMARVAELRVRGDFRGAGRRNDPFLKVLKAAIELDPSIPDRVLRELEKYNITDDEGEHWVINDSMKLKRMGDGSGSEDESECESE